LVHESGGLRLKNGQSDHYQKLRSNDNVGSATVPTSFRRARWPALRFCNLLLHIICSLAWR